MERPDPWLNLHIFRDGESPMNRMAKFFTSAMLIMTGACAMTPDDTFVVNEETIENFFDPHGPQKAWDPGSDLNLLWDQPVARAEFPALGPGETRVYGTLDSVGIYRTTAKLRASYPDASMRGSTFTHSKFGLLGPATPTGGNAWFFADIDASGQIVHARAYMYGFENGVCDMRQKAKDTYGKISSNGFILTIDGPCAFQGQFGTTAEYAIVIEGTGDLLSSPNGREFSIRYIVDNNGKFRTIPENPEKYREIYDYGYGQARIMRNPAD